MCVVVEDGTRRDHLLRHFSHCQVLDVIFVFVLRVFLLDGLDD